MKSLSRIRLPAWRPDEAGLRRALELVAFALALPLAGHVLLPSDPFGMASGFPWVVVGPAVVAARYGVNAGLICAALAATAFVLSHAAYPEQRQTLTALAIGTVLLSLLIGEVSEAWRRRGLRAEAENRYLRHRLERFSNDYQVLKVSHGQLEEHLVGQKLSLRGALLQLRRELAGSERGLDSGEALMAVFAQFCSVQIAGLYAMKTATVIDTEPRAVHGAMGELPLFDPLLRLALSERRLVSVKSESAAADRHQGGLLAVVPIIDAQEHLHAVLAVRDMHFMAFQQRNLNLLALLASYIGDMIGRGGALGEAPAERLVADLETALRFAGSHAMISSLLCLRLAPHPRAGEIGAYLASRIRGLDYGWLAPSVDAAEERTVVVLLPLVAESGANAWLARVADETHARFDVALADVLVSARAMQLSARHELGDCFAFIGADEHSPRAGRMLDLDDASGEGEHADRAA